MIVGDDIIQGTAEWFAVKWGKIGGTRSSGLLKPTESLLIKLLAEHTETFELEEDSWTSSEMLRGIELEPEARRQLSEYAGVEFFTAGWLQSKEFPLLGISPDGISNDLTIACEIKCPGRNKHTETILNNEIPAEHIHQCLHYFTVNPYLEKLYFCSFRPESLKPLFVKELTRESVIDMGWIVKGKVKEDRGRGVKDYVCECPDLKTVAQWVEIFHTNTKLLATQIEEKTNLLNF